MTGRTEFLDAASTLGHRVAEAALWQDEACTWNIVAPERAGGSEVSVRTEIAGGAVYNGAAGIALFLIELYGVTGDPLFRRTALGALRYALSHLEKVGPDEFGFHSGRVGVGYVAARGAVALDEESLLRGAETVLGGLLGREANDRGMDLISGAAGAIPALLSIRDLVPDMPLGDMAVALGERLLRLARYEVQGWSWGMPPGSAMRNLTGYAHGAAGVGHALVELYAHTGDGRFKYGAEQAFAYERQFFDSKVRNWPDFRDLDLWEMLHQAGWRRLRDMLSKGERPSRPGPVFMWAWCHGAPGIGLSRIRAHEILGDAILFDEAEVAGRSTLASTRENSLNYSLCHGVAGNCETLLQLADASGDASLRRDAEDLMLQGVERYERRRGAWPCGTPRAATDPGLMVGESGIGHFLLRLAVGVPPILLIRGTAERMGASDSVPGAEYESARRQHVAAYFGRTHHILSILGHQVGHRASSSERTPWAGVSDARHEIGNVIHQTEEGDTRVMLEDAVALDLTRLEMTLEIDDFRIDTLVAAERSLVPATLEEETSISVVRPCRLVRSRWDWDRWIGADPRGPWPSAAPDAGIPYLLWRAERTIHYRRLEPLPACVFEVLLGNTKEVWSVADVVRAVASTVEGVDPPALYEAVQTQLRSAVGAGILRVMREDCE